MKTNRVALVNWSPSDGVAQAIQHELVGLGYVVTPFIFTEPIPDRSDIVFSFAPYGELLKFASRIGDFEASNRPLLIHWDTEGIPDPRIPWTLAEPICKLQSWIGRHNQHGSLKKIAHRFRYVGDNLYAYKKGWLNLFVNFSDMYGNYYRNAGLPTLVVPWGTSKLWHKDLGLERDIDVLWMGKRRTKRRSTLLESLRSDLEARGLKMYIADGVENPFIFGETRTELLNRAKITLNLRWHHHDNVFSSRFHMAAGNRSLIVSEPFVPHHNIYQDGVHYLSAPLSELRDRILTILSDTGERDFLVENAYDLVTTRLTLSNSVATIMRSVEAQRPTDKNRKGTKR